ncbi:hypothetical protein B0T22DRAFT_293227 [Podospora appendiculata]|uniref:Uncharacterized protein n=1 Tax=Podospora appendiculata TaxID=314037 RepID=A0AAE0X1G7_9PEZI|nr:hypothetical protein B0T22DRAFT_293227 [Podospora appendiculata]
MYGGLGCRLAGCRLNIYWESWVRFFFCLFLLGGLGGGWVSLFSLFPSFLPRLLLLTRYISYIGWTGWARVAVVFPFGAAREIYLQGWVRQLVM